MKPLTILLFILLSFSKIYGQDALLWHFPTGAGVFSSPTSDDSCIYIGSNDSCLYALNKADGKLKWKFKTSGEVKSKPLLYKGSIIFNSTDGLIYAVDRSAAQIQWTFKTDGEQKVDMWDYYLSSPVCHSDKVFVGSGDGHVYAIEPNSGELIWKFKTDGVVHATPLVYNEEVYVGSFDGFFYALNIHSGKLKWKFNTIGDAYFPKGEIQRKATIYKNTVIFGSRDFNIYSLDIKTGRGMWNMKEKGGWIIATPLLFNDVIYFGTSDSHQFCGLNAQTGDTKWSIPLNMRVYGEAVPYNSSIIFGCFNGKLYSVNDSSGEMDQIFQTYGSRSNYHDVYNKNDEFKAGFELYGKDIEASEKKILSLGAIASTPLINNGIIYFADTNGIIYAYQFH